MGKKKDKQWWMRVDQEIAQLKLFNSTLDGQAKFKGKHIGAEIERVDGRRIFRLGTINDSLSEEPGFTFEAGDLSIKVTGRTTAQRNTVNVREGWASRYTEGIVEEFRTVNWTSRPGCFRSYYLSRSNQLLYQLFGNIGALDICLKGVKLRLVQEDHYIIVAALVPVAYEVFNELSYALLVALGFVSGEFLQNEVFSFRVKTANSRLGNSFHYRSLRKGGTSVYQALVWIPFGYEEMIGRPLAEKLYKNKTLIPLDIPTITELARQVLDDHHIKYALVLLNDANESSQSLLIRNNCFFIVMEVLRKTYYEQVKDQLPKDYSNRPHLQKFRNVFEAIAPITDQEAELLALRNTFMHGDIRNIEGEEMMRIMHRQLSLIYKLVLTHAGFSGYTIDHYFLRHGPAKKAFTKLIPGFAKIGVSTTDDNLEN